MKYSKKNKNYFKQKKTNKNPFRKTYKKTYNKKTHKNLFRKTYKKSYKKTYRNIKKDYHTYIVKSKVLNENLIKKIMEKRGNWRPFHKIHKNSFPDFIYTDFTTTHGNKDLFDLKVGIKNIIGEEKKKISKKNNLNETLKETLKKHPNEIFAKCLIQDYTINIIPSNFENIKKLGKELFEKKKVWILKPIKGLLGMGIEIFDNYADFIKFVEDNLEPRDINDLDYEEVREKYKLVGEINKIVIKAIFLSKEYVIEEYILDPLLFENKKFHIRPVFLYHKRDNKTVEGSLFKKILLAHAKEDYIKDDFKNIDIHDSHFRSTSRRLFFPNAFENTLTENQIQDLMEQINMIGKYIIGSLDVGCYKESKYCYEVLGVDIIITKDLQCKIMEVQMTNISFATTKFNDALDEELFESCMENVIDYYYPPANPIEPINGFTKLNITF